MRVLRRLSFSVLTLIALIVFIAGCQPQNEHLGGLVRPKVVTSVVSLSPSTSELIGYGSSIGLLKGKTKYCNYPPSIAKVPVVADVKPNYEMIKDVNPDIIIFDQSLYSDQDVAKIRAIGADVIAINANTLDGFIDQLYSIGRATQNEIGYSQFGDKIMQAREAARSVAPKPAVKIAMVMPGQNGAHMIAGSGSFLADLLKQSGYEPVGPAGNVFVALNAEFLIQQNPDFIITAGPATDFLNDKRFASLNAVKQQHVVPVNADIMLRRGSRVDVLIQGISQIVLQHKDKK